MKLFIGNLPYSASDEELNELFGQYGSVVSARVIHDRETGRSRGFGFVEMGSSDEGTAAMEALNGADMGGRAIVVNEANERAPRR